MIERSTRDADKPCKLRFAPMRANHPKHPTSNVFLLQPALAFRSLFIESLFCRTPGMGFPNSLLS
jgi:hypothetical protein